MLLIIKESPTTFPILRSGECAIYLKTSGAVTGVMNDVNSEVTFSTTMPPRVWG